MNYSDRISEKGSNSLWLRLVRGASQHRSAGFQPAVSHGFQPADLTSLPGLSKRLQAGSPAIQQVGNLRYGALLLVLLVVAALAAGTSTEAAPFRNLQVPFTQPDGTK